MGLFNKLFKRKEKNVKSAIHQINEELLDDQSKQVTPKENTKILETEILEEEKEPEPEVVEETTKEPEPEVVEETIKEPEPEVVEETIKEPEPEIVEETIKEPEPEIIEETTKELKPEVIEETIKEPELEVIEEAIKEPEVVKEDLTKISKEEIEVVEEVAQEEIEEDQEFKEEAPKKKGFMKRLFGGLSKTRESIVKGVDNVLSSFKQIDEELYEELEEALIIADFGVETTMHIMDQLRAKVKAKKITDPLALKPALQEIITEFLTSQPVEEVLSPTGPTVVLVIGVNGVGKTTSIGKMSYLFKSQDKRVLVAAADTFRAAAIEQLSVWTERADVEIIKHSEGSDAAAVVFDAIAAAKSRKVDVLICDTAGRLQNKTNLMKELEKISRVIAREYPEAKKEILIVIDATTGQNALQQVKLFKEVAAINGIILTKLDGTAKGGAIVSIYDSLKVPVKYIGVGEKIDDLQPFDANAFAKALFDDAE